jgi:hypothetical protein
MLVLSPFRALLRTVSGAGGACSRFAAQPAGPATGATPMNLPMSKGPVQT